ncbi:RES domain-containing protein [Curtobacterium pusillum]|uniref:RES domain-containing protein n=1 Tax=Curtobacterium pusillum TaxID=69373 RepID=UPI001642B4DA|nr:RES domain-containing protein [Curtobacterium pusillum]
MDEDTPDWATIEGAVCLSHIVDTSLRESVGNATDRSCTICGRAAVGSEPAFAVAWDIVVEPFMRAFWREYERPEAAPTPSDLEDTTWAVGYLAQYAFDVSHIEAIGSLISDAIAVDEVSTYGAAISADGLSHEWDDFESTVKHESRFVFMGSDGPSARVQDFLRKLGELASDGSGLVSHLLPEDPLYRARTVAWDWSMTAKLPTSATELGPAPADRAAANRMSPAGIPMFYGAEDEATALNEVGAFSIAQHAVVGAFYPTRPLRMLDLRTASIFASPFDEQHLELRILLLFLEEFQQAISRPIVPDGRQHIDYVPTQVVAEFFRRAVNPPLDGIVFASAHTGNSNCVIFATDQNVANNGAVEAERSVGSILPDADYPEVLLTLDPSSVVLRRLVHRVDHEALGRFDGSRWSISEGNRYSLSRE